MKKVRKKLEEKGIAKAYCTCKKEKDNIKNETEIYYGHREVKVDSDGICIDCGYYAFWNTNIENYKNRGFDNRELDRYYMNSYYFETYNLNLRS